MALRWGIASCGKISSDFVNALSLLPEHEHRVVAVAAGKSQEKAQGFIVSNNISTATAYGCYQDLFTDNTVDIVYVGNLHPQHKDTVIGALEADKHVLCEKPLGMSLAEVQQMVICARNKKKFLMEAFWSRFFPVYNHIQTELKDYLGEPKVTVYMNQEALSPRLFEPQLGGSGLLDPGCYPIQFALWVFGGEKPQKIVATGCMNEKTGVDECASVALVFSGNRMAQLFYALKTRTNCDAIIYGANGKFIKLPEKFWCPKKLETSDAVLDFPVSVKSQAADLSFNFPDSAGLVYEANCVRECINKGLVECPTMTLDDSLIIAEVMEECHKQLYCSNRSQ